MSDESIDLKRLKDAIDQATAGIQSMPGPDGGMIVNVRCHHWYVILKAAQSLLPKPLLYWRVEYVTRFDDGTIGVRGFTCDTRDKAQVASIKFTNAKVTGPFEWVEPPV